MKKKRLGEGLRERGHVSAADLNTALQEQQAQASLKQLIKIWREQGRLPRDHVVARARVHVDVQYMHLSADSLPPQHRADRPQARCHRSVAI